MTNRENEEDQQVESEPLDEDGEHVVAQQNVGRQNTIGGGEWPDPDTPPRGPSPGTTWVADDPDERADR